MNITQFNSNSTSSLGEPFSMSYSYPSKDLDDIPTIIDTFSPKLHMHDLSPTSTTSSSSSDFDAQLLSYPRFSFEAFVTTRSRVVRLYNLPRLAESYLSALFLPQSTLRGQRPIPMSLWTTREDSDAGHTDSIWAVFKTHEEAASALSLSGPAMSVTTALESDLEPFNKLRRFVFASPPTSARLSTAPSHQLNSMADYTLSSNPPNPRNSFRLGDWICSSPKCAAHNFGQVRNLACIGCGCPRGNPSANTPQQPQQHYQTARSVSSPRFASYTTQPAPQQQQQPLYSTYNPTAKTTQNQPSPPKNTHPLLTPSGRAFAVGGKVQNISSDPLNPCVMYWPDNEPFPEQGQIRPSGLVGIPQPPILNTGNRGPISHQPGDWICLKCNYLNWRRRKVCQTCLPYAEGNGDSISAAVQAERIALLTSVLAQTQAQAAAPQTSLQPPRSHSLTPPQHRRSFIDVSPPQSQLQIHTPVHRSQSHFDLNTRYSARDTSPIYQTSGNPRQPSPLYSTGPEFHTLPVHAPAPLLPSFLQDMVQSPALSPASSSSADLSFEEYDELTATKRSSFPRARKGDDAANDYPLGNIWRLDGEESKSLSAFALPNQQDLIGSGKRNSKDVPRLQVITS